MGRVEPGSWQHEAWKVINAVHETLPADATIDQRKKALLDAYPFGERAMHPYKMWLKAQRAYLARYDPKPAGPLAPVMSPLERAKARSEMLDARAREANQKLASIHASLDREPHP